AEGERDRLLVATRALGPRVNLLRLRRVLVGIEEGGRPQPDRVPAVAERAGALERGVGVTADPDRDTRLLRGLRQRVDGGDPVVRALEADGVAGPREAHETEVLVGHGAARLERRRGERLELLADPAHPRAEDDAPQRAAADGREPLRATHP